MFDLFGIRARRLEKLKLKKIAYQERKAKIKAWHNDYYHQQDEVAYKKYAAEKDRVNKTNSTCSRCGSTNVINHIRRTKGSLHGEGNLSGGFFLGCGGIHGESEINGHLDTLPVNKCADCGNEWQIEEIRGKETLDNFNTYSSREPQELIEVVVNYLELKYDPKDVKDTYNSLEEKKQAFIKRHSSDWYFKTYRTAPRYMIEYAVFHGLERMYWQSHYKFDEASEVFDFSKKQDEYSYVLPNKVWKLIKTIIGWKGTEE